jgi:hypothetical protein
MVRRRRWSTPVALASGACLLGAFLLAPPDAGAWVQATARSSGVPLRWEGTNCIVVRANAEGCADIEDGAEFQALVDAARSWEQAIASCSYIRFVVREPSTEARWGTGGQPPEVAVVWVKQGWSEQPGHLPEQTALTAIWHHDGAIYDADIEINDESDPPFSTSGETGTIDLQGTLTHELGHVLGLDEVCYLGTTPPDPHPADHLGRPIPACGSASQEIREATMYPGPRPGKRTPEADDVAGICALYPRQDDPGTCALDEEVGCGCAVAMRSRSGGGGLVLLLALLWLARVARPNLSR